MPARFLAALAVAAAIAAGGCGGTTTDREAADIANGKELFVQKCGTCHALADAGTQGQAGPSLDAAFARAREGGFDDSTFFEITLEQIDIPAPPMPPDLVTGEDAVDVAAYVAQVAGKPGEAPLGKEVTDGKTIFTRSGCGSCHTLADAGTTGTFGTNFDEEKPGLQEAIEQIRKGGNGMPPYEGKLSDAQIESVAQYIRGGGS